MPTLTRSSQPCRPSTFFTILASAKKANEFTSISNVNDRDFVTVSFEAAVGGREAHRNSPLNLNAQGFSVASLEEAISRAGVEARHQIYPLTAHL
jgi:hypothetical protein